MQKTILALALVLMACTSRPPVAPQPDGARTAIDVKYVGVPTIRVYAEASDVAPVVTTYGYTETVSILARKGDWVEIRTVDGSGWSHAADLISGQEVKAILDSTTPRFLTPPVAIPDSKARGEIVLQAKVNTDGDVVQVWTTSNTTGSKRLEEANSAALQQAKFYPIVQKGQRLSFTYAYEVTY
jgi:hypothetical protein